MEYDAAVRLTPEEALSHPFLAPLCPYKYVMTPKGREPRGTRLDVRRCDGNRVVTFRGVGGENLVLLDGKWIHSIVKVKK